MHAGECMLPKIQGRGKWKKIMHMQNRSITPAHYVILCGFWRVKVAEGFRMSWKLNADKGQGQGWTAVKQVNVEEQSWSVRPIETPVRRQGQPHLHVSWILFYLLLKTTSSRCSPLPSQSIPLVNWLYFAMKGLFSVYYYEYSWSSWTLLLWYNICK